MNFDRTRARKAIKRQGHHMWSAERDSRGRINLRRHRSEKEMFEKNEEMKRAASRCNASRKNAEDICSAYWGLFGAGLVDDATLANEIPVSISRRFNAANTSEKAPKVYSWEELVRAFGQEKISTARKAIADGMKVRMASKYLDVPFIIAAEIVDKFENINPQAMKQTVDMVKTGSLNHAAGEYYTLARRVARIFKELSGNSHKLAVDSAAESYWKEYLGMYGEELVREIKKRVRADLAASWLRKNGVDAAAAEYWSKYFGEYGAKWVSVVPKKISPSK